MRPGTDPSTNSSGIYGVRYWSSQNGTFNERGECTTSFTGDGQYGLNVVTVDNAGNDSQLVGKTINIDTKAPNIASLSTSPGGETAIKLIPQNITDAYGDSGIRLYAGWTGSGDVRLSDTTHATTLGSDGSFTVNVPNAGFYLASVVVVDNAGNLSNVVSSGTAATSMLAYDVWEASWSGYSFVSDWYQISSLPRLPDY